MNNNEILLHFRLLSAPVAIATDLSADSAQVAPLELCLDLGIGYQVQEAPAEGRDSHPPDSASIPATSRKVDSFIYNQEHCIYPL